VTAKDRLITIHAKMADVTEAEVDEVLNLTADMRDAEVVRLRAEKERLRHALVLVLIDFGGDYEVILREFPASKPFEEILTVREARAVLGETK